MHVANTEMGQVGNNVGQGAKDGQTLCFVVVDVPNIVDLRNQFLQKPRLEMKKKRALAMSGIKV